MNKPYAIFDMDGTLVDSMPAWKNLGRDYLTAKGIPVPADLRRRVATMTMAETGAYFNTLGLEGSPEQLAAEMNELMHEKYRTTIGPREGVGTFLEALQSRGVRMCVATATDSQLAATCLNRLGLMQYFSFVVSCEDTGIGKTSPHIYQLAAARLGASDPGEVAVLEDAPYAARTARDAGFYAVGVYDPSSERRQEELRAIVYEYIDDYRTAAAALRSSPPPSSSQEDDA